VLSRRGVGGEASGARSARRGKRWRFLADELRQRLYRLEKLAAAGLLGTATADPASRRPGPGRAPKAYRPAAAEVAVSIPERRYDLLGEVLAQAIVADGPASSVRLAAQQLARERGRALGERVRSKRRLGRLGPERALTVVGELLAACGYAPARAPAQLQLVLRNCPFRQLARRAPELVCGLNQDFVAGLLAGLRASRIEAVLQPDPARCCVLLQGPTH
jgi:predicted ArsR family transcriptional regulator